MTTPPPSTSVLFIAGAALKAPALTGPNLRVNRYQVEEVVRVRGEAFAEIPKGSTLFRVESPLSVEWTPEGQVLLSLRGTVRHLNYTPAAQREELGVRSAREFEPSTQTCSVLIPIRKSNDWWQLAQDQRQAHFHGGRTEGHNAIGMRYTERIFRKLYHCRYSDPRAPFDFLTYFEFPAARKEDFRSLLGELRDPERNPEWGYVEREFEVWMTKAA